MIPVCRHSKVPGSSRQHRQATSDVESDVESAIASDIERTAGGVERWSAECRTGASAAQNIDTVIKWYTGI